ncbi:DUF2878 domain-containing protein [Alteromonas gilva]|uniref:DUF2878 domain-containing protein n=1 Tax=Alteromonas gilva TaxID=2987522 RepID=A0ABT5L209_9ALTE|nr:DUF2878 domain-containing protein [Alteromonas gilva]MDC8830912.1 DUF2878 domain-containing protein [Alteromonas gilva]
MQKFINFAGFQLLWWLLILGQNQYAWLALVLLGVHVALSGSVQKEILILLAAGVIGTAVDSVLALSGVYIFSPSPKILLIPLWLSCLWLAFAATLRHSLSYLRHKYGLAALLGCIGGPASYLAGMKLGAVQFGPGVFVVMALLVGIWACLMPLLFYISNVIEARFDALTVSTADNKKE